MVCCVIGMLLSLGVWAVFERLYFVQKRSLIEFFVNVNTLFVIAYFSIAVILIPFEYYSVRKNLIGVVIVGLLANVFFLGKHRNRCKMGNKNVQCFLKPSKMEWVMLITCVVIIFPLISVTVEDISTVSDQGSYFLHTISLMEECTKDLHSIPEYGEISKSVDQGLIDLQDEMTIFYHQSGEYTYYVHALSTWCSLLALFGKIFGLKRCMLGCNYLFLLLTTNMFYLARKVCKKSYGGIISLVVFSLSPVILYIGKAGLSEVAFGFLLLVGLKYIIEEHYYLAALSVGLAGFVHISMYIYIPIIVVVCLLESSEEGKQNIGYFNLIQLLLFAISVCYSYKISPIYAANQYGRLNLGGRLNETQIFLMMQGIILLTICIQVVWMIKRKKTRKIKQILLNKFGVVYRILLCGILAVTVYYTYYLCFTNKYAIDYDFTNSWSMRSEYVNTGISAVSHLNIINIARGSGWAGLIAVLLIWLRKKNLNDTAKILSVILMYSLLVYTVYRMDTPFNYYASRYFTPVIFPLIALVLEASDLKIDWVVYMLIVAFEYNMRFLPTFFQGAPFVGQYKVLEDVLKNIPEGAIVLCGTDSTYANTRLTTNLRILNENKVYNLKNLNEIKEYYKNNEIYVISDSELKKNMHKVYSKHYFIQYSFGHGENCTYATTIDGYQTSIYVYTVE